MMVPQEGHDTKDQKGEPQATRRKAKKTGQPKKSSFGSSQGSKKRRTWSLGSKDSTADKPEANSAPVIQTPRRSLVSKITGTFRTDQKNSHDEPERQRKKFFSLPRKSRVDKKQECTPQSPNLRDEINPQDLEYFLQERRNQISRFQPILLQYERARLTQIPLKLLIQNQDSPTFAAFACFLEQEHAIENLQYWAACQKYRKTFLQNTPEINAACAKSIHRVFLTKDAPLWVCTSNEILRCLETRIGNGQFTADMFEEAKDRAYSEMQVDMLPRFVEAIFPERQSSKEKLESIYVNATWDLFEVRGVILHLLQSCICNA